MNTMEIELLVVPDCPHERGATELFRTALDDIGLTSVPIQVVVIDSLLKAKRRAFVGSPTFAVDGIDVFAIPGAAASIACRVYPGDAGLPDLADLRKALKQAAAASVLR